MRVLLCVALLCLLVGILPAVCQEGGGKAAPKEQPREQVKEPGKEQPKEREKGQAEEPGMDEMLKAMGMGEEERAIMQALTQGGEMDPATMLLLMMMMGKQGGGGDGGDIMGLLLFSKLLSAGGKAAQPVTVLNGNILLIVEDGSLYQLDVSQTPPKLLGTTPYRKKAGGGNPLAALAPIFGKVRGKAEQTSCMSNLKQLCLATIMLANDYDETLPVPEALTALPIPPQKPLEKEDWVTALEPYFKNREILRCPSAPNLPVGYAFNRALLGAKLADIPNPAQTVMLFDSDLGGEHPVGGAEALAGPARHEGMVNLGFVDGHVQTCGLEEAKQLLAGAAGGQELETVAPAPQK